MKILLIYPYFIEDRVRTKEDVSTVPLGLYYIGSLLIKTHYDVEILNWYNINENPARIKDVLTEKKPDVIGFSILNANRWGGIEIARVAKQVDPHITTVFGGIGATFLWDHILNHFHEVDFVVIGEGEYTFFNLLQLLEAKRSKSPETVKGIAFRKDGKAVRTENAAAICELDDLPIPANYFTYRHLALTRGCAGNCNFCGSPQFWGRHVRFHSSHYFVEQLEQLYQHGIRFFYFTDDTFTINKGLVIEICKKIIEKGMKITWNAISRVDFISDDLLYWMRKAGCIQISFGVESGSEKIRSFLQKKITISKIQKAFGLTQKYGIMARAYFIYGCPGESWQTIQETIDLIDDIKPLGTIFYILDIFPGTQLYEDFKQRAKVTDDIWLNRIEDIMYFETDANLTRELMLAFGQKLRASFYGNLATYVEALKLIEKKDLYPSHSDFYTRLAMTFDHGDYSRIDAIENKEKIAEKLYKRALMYSPNKLAYLGLGILNQKNGDNQKSIEILKKGLSYFPDDAQLNICLGISLMNLGDYDHALSRFLAFRGNKDAVNYAAKCYEALGDEKNAAAFDEIFESM